MPKRRRLNLTDKQRKQLENLRDHHRRPDVREKSAALLKIDKGQSPHLVAKEGLLKQRDPDTVYNWLNLYQANGIEGLIKNQQGGNRRNLRDKKKRNNSKTDYVWGPTETGTIKIPPTIQQFDRVAGLYGQSVIPSIG